MLKRCVGAALSAALCVGATRTAAEWSAQQSTTSALMRQMTNGLSISFYCQRSNQNRLDLLFDRNGQELGSVPAIMLWIVAPDGRMARHSMDAFKEGPGISATLLTSSVVLDQLRQASALEFTVGGQLAARTDTKGTGAFRLAVLERCGF